MSLLGAMNTAISGLDAQSASFSNISDNMANSQTVGYKEVGTNFQDYLTQSNATENESGSVVALPDYENDIQGTIGQTSNPLNMAVSGSGFFAVSEADGATTTGEPTFTPEQYYTRAGDFSLNANGYLVNSAGGYLNGWTVDPNTGVVDESALVPLQVGTSSYAPQATSSVELAASLPANAVGTTIGQAATVSSQLQVYDALGDAHTVTLEWTQAGSVDAAGTFVATPNVWDLTVYNPQDTVANDGTGDLGSAVIAFGGTVAFNGSTSFSDGTNGGTLADLTANPGTPSGIANGATGSTGAALTVPAANTSGAATFSFVANYGQGPQTVTVNLGSYGSSAGTVQYAGTAYTLNGLTQNGVPPGSFSSVTAQTNGDVVVNYNNGQSRTVAQVPVVTFTDPDALQSQNGQSYTATSTSGSPLANQAGSGGAGKLVTSSVEASNVDLATQLSSLIVAQQAYSANAKVVTSADDLLTTTLNMKQS